MLNFNIERRIWILGLFLILYGLYITELSWYYDWLDHEKIGSASSIFWFWMNTGFIVSGIGIILRWHFSRIVFNLIAGFRILYRLNVIIWWGYNFISIRYIIDFFLIIIFICLVNTNYSIKYIEEYPNAYFKYFHKIALGIVIILAIGDITFIGIKKWYAFGGNRFHGIEPLAYDSIYKSANSNYLRTSLPFKYSIDLPEGYSIYAVKNGNSIGTLVLLSDSKRTYIALNPDIVFTGLYAYNRSYFHEDISSYEFAKKLLSERYGLIPISSKRICSDCIYKIEQFQIQDIKGFKVIGLFKNEENNFDSSVFFYKDNQIIGSIFARSLHGISVKQLNEIITSVKPNKSALSEQQYMQEAKKLYENKEYRRANFLFASALILNRWNAEAYYYLGSSLFKTGNMEGAGIVLTEALRQKKDYQEAKDLLAKIKQAEASKKNDQKKDK